VRWCGGLPPSSPQDPVAKLVSTSWLESPCLNDAQCSTKVGSPRPPYRHCGHLIEAPWLVNGGHGASVTQRFVCGSKVGVPSVETVPECTCGDGYTGGDCNTCEVNP
jgi:hypothetical protein